MPHERDVSLTCSGVAVAASPQIYSLRFELTNPGNATVDLSFYEPFIAFSIDGAAGDRPATAHQPALDVPARAMTLSVPPQSTVTLPTPIRLHIAEGALPGTDGFVWTIPFRRDSVSLQVRLQFAERPDVVGPLTFA